MSGRLFFLIGFLLLGLSGYGQKITISATILDKESREPLPFATIAIKGKNVATVSNLQGQFDFHIPASYRNETLVISMLGYVNFEAPVWTLLETPALEISLESSLTLLDEVTVVGDSLKGEEIFTIAWNRIPQNFPDKPYLLDGFYRDVKTIGGTYISLLEAAVKVYDENYEEPRNKNKLRERVKLIEVRKSLGYESRFAPFFGQKNLLEDLLLHNNIRYRQIDLNPEFLNGIKREKDTYFNNHQVYMVTYDKEFKLTLLIDKSDYAILHMDYTMKLTGEMLDRRRSVVSKEILYNKAIDFRKYEGKMYLNYISVSTNESWFDLETGSPAFDTGLIQFLLVNEIETQPTEKIRSTEQMKAYGLQFQDYPYNKNFWENYNVLKDSPLDTKILQDLEKHLPLNIQFEN